MTRFNHQPRSDYERDIESPHEQSDHLKWKPIFPSQEETGSSKSCSTRRGPRWIAICLFCIAIVILISNLNHIGALIRTIGHIGPGWNDGDRTTGLAALGIVLVAILAAMRIALDASRDRNK